MIMAAIANELSDRAMQHAFSDGPVERTIRPLIAAEEFFAGPPAQTVAARPKRDDLPEPIAGTKERTPIEGRGGGDIAK